MASKVHIAGEDAAHAGLPEYIGYLGVVDGHGQWHARLVVVRDHNGAVTMSLYDASTTEMPPDESKLVQVLALEGHVAVGEYHEPAHFKDVLLHHKPAVRERAFTLTIGDKSYGFEATTAENREVWVKHLSVFLDKYQLGKNAPAAKVAPGPVLKSAAEDAGTVHPHK